MGATLVGAAASLVVAMWPLRSAVTFADASPTPPRAVARSIVPVVIGLLAITAFSSIDVIVAKAALDSTSAGVYGGASLIGRVLLYVPTAIATVLLPKVALRVESDRETRDIVAPSLAVTLAFCAMGIAIYTLFSHPLATIVLGHKYAEAGPILWMFALAMTGYALLNVLLMYHLGRGVVGFAWLLLAGAALQACAYAVFHHSPR
jgi:O-antigen/teichoic acid export membrane protein